MGSKHQKTNHPLHFKTPKFSKISFNGKNTEFSFTDKITPKFHFRKESTNFSNELFMNGRIYEFHFRKETAKCLKVNF